MIPSRRKKSILLVNPWIYDFAAYDLWMKPLGLLYLGGILRSEGYGVSLLDFLDFSSLPEDLASGLKPPGRKAYGQGHFFKEIISKPKPLRGIARHYRRYGVPPATLNRLVGGIPAPDLILVTSSMTYWYPGVMETIRFLRDHFPGEPIMLGGIYATLCPDHARMNSGADRVLSGPWGEGKMKIIADALGEKADRQSENFSSWPYPVFDLYRRVGYVSLLTRLGCPFSCAYCASSRLSRGLEARSADSVIKEILHWKRRFGVNNFAFYDDALFIDASEHIVPILRYLIRKKISCLFHTPNALHVRAIDEETAGLMFGSGFKTIRLGLETSDESLQAETGGKVDNREFRTAVRNLKRAGYKREEIGVYLLVGLPGQNAQQVSASIAFVKENGARPMLVEYSPIPGTRLFEKARQFSPFDIENEPLFQNNSLLPCQWEGLTWRDYRRLKEETAS